MRTLRLNNNGIMGVIPSELGGLTQLQQLYLADNQLRGLIPSELGNLGQLTALDLSGNKLIGHIPGALGNLQQATNILLSDNELTGPIADAIGNLPNLMLLDLSHNQIGGEIPATLGNLPQIVDLYLSHNQFTGRIPVALGSLTTIGALDVSFNQLSDQLPVELGALPFLRNLHVEQNQLGGPIPDEYTALTLNSFHYNDTNLCEPNTATINNWLDTIGERVGTSKACAPVNPDDAHFIITYDAQGGRTLPGTPVRIDEQEPVGDRDVDNAHDFARATYSYYINTHNRNSYDGAGATIVSSAHYGRNYNNAFWDGQQMVYGDGFAARDVVAHELTHAVTEHSANLEYKWQSGALNESFSDIFGAMVDRDDWLMGEDLAPDALGGREAIRSLADPAKFGQPAHTDDWVRTCSDNEGVHTNSGIFNKAYYNIATAITKEQAERIFYRALTTYVGTQSSFADARAAVLQATADIHGSGTDVYRAVEDGFNAVGLTAGWRPDGNSCVCAATTAVLSAADAADSVSALQVVSTLYAVRDNVMTDAPIGRHYSELYYKHTRQITMLLLFNGDLRTAGTRLLRTFTPGLQGLADGHGVDVITPEMAQDVQNYVDALAETAAQNNNAELAQAIADERARIDWSQLEGKTFDEAWRYLNTLVLQNQLFLPIFENH
ncbi:MAG: M4 family metallopeptidase [Caldilineaceae bacterium]|nr:M4 family metallopeptidase [Caldilineaceae bacterium]